jgi:hypothetical protein
MTAPAHPPKRATGPPELHHSEGRYQHRRRRTRVVTGERRRTTVRTYGLRPTGVYNGWKDVEPGWFEMDLVATAVSGWKAGFSGLWWPPIWPLAGARRRQRK